MTALSVRDVAKRYNKTPYQVVYAISKGLIPAEKWGWIWTIREEDLPKTWPMKGRGRPRTRGD